LYVTHNLQELQDFATRYFFCTDGTVAEKSRPF